MGLPLFVAPVESDLPHKAAGKNGVLSPSRSAIRRPNRPDSRDRRNARRAAVRMFGISQPNLPPTTQERQLPSDLDRGLDPERPSSEDHAARALRETLDGMRAARRRHIRRRETLEEELEEHMSSLFGGTLHDIGSALSRRESELESQREDGRQEIDLGWWSVEPQPRARHAHVVESTAAQHSHSPNRHRPYNIGSPPLHPTRDWLQRRAQNASATLTPDDEGVQRSAASLNETLRRRSRARFLQNLRNRSPLRRARGVDGLGDRDRSLSPEVWDTLLSTLTPDPQPPSAGSSFASAVASQSAGPSNAPLSAPDPAEEAAMDPACESGCENSDPEEPDYAVPDLERIRRRRARWRRNNVRVPEYNLDGPSEGPFARHTQSTGRPPSGLRTQADGWTAGLSAGPSEDERAADRSRHREDSAGIGTGAQTGDEEWLGMQRIVRSLAAREDIPDEWWAEAGLSRTLPQDETN